MQEYGVIPQPTVTLRRLTSDDVCVVVASDGVWEALSATEAVATVCDSLAEGASVDDAARSLCQASVAVVHACGRNSQPDNTTAALVIFDEIIAD